jgi:hypothetical protein
MGSPENKKQNSWAVWAKRFGIGAFLFFLIKGLAWIAIALLAGKALFDSK